MLKNLSGESIANQQNDVAIDKAGATIYAVASSNQFGTNPKFGRQIFKWDTATGTGTQLTSFELDVAAVSVSDDGQWLAFLANGDLAGANHDESYEVFVMHPDGTGLSQVTNDASRVGDGVGTLAIAGSGNRIVFSSDTDPLGTNPGRTPHYFVVDRDGGNVVQLASGPNLYGAAAISDDGSRIAYVVNNQFSHSVYASPADGSTPPQIIATPTNYIYGFALSGNGQTVVFDNYPGISKVSFDGTGLVSSFVASGGSPSITDDGATVFYLSNGVSRIAADGTGAAVIAASTPPLYYTHPLVSGDGSRVAALALSGQVPGGNNPDQGNELVTMDASGGALTQLTLMSVRPMLSQPYNDWAAPISPRILANGTRVYFESDGDPVGLNPGHYFQVFTMLANGTGLAQVTQLTTHSAETLSVADNGVIVFESYMGGNWQFFKVNTTGTGLTQLTTFGIGPGFGRYPIVRFDAQMILYAGTVTSGWGFQKISINGGAATTVVPLDGDDYLHFRMSTLPTWIVYDAPGNLDGLNPNHRYQIQRVTFTGTNYQRITSDPTYDSNDPDVSSDGSKIVWYSQADFTGGNSDHNSEVFLYDAPTASIRQLTSTTGGWGVSLSRITRDGSWVYYELDSDVLRVSVATGEVQRVTGFTPGGANFSDADTTGAKTLFTGYDVVHESPGWRSLFLSDASLKPAFHVGKAAPTLVDWDPDPQSLTYDVIRGDLANLSIVASTANLGPVTCLEDDSPDNKTLGDEDATQPAPGQGFFYLYRGTTGSPPVAGSWGLGTGGLVRVPGLGGCSP